MNYEVQASNAGSCAGLYTTQYHRNAFERASSGRGMPGDLPLAKAYLETRTAEISKSSPIGAWQAEMFRKGIGSPLIEDQIHRDKFINQVLNNWG